MMKFSENDRLPEKGNEVVKKYLNIIGRCGLPSKRFRKLHFKLSELKVTILPLTSPLRKLNVVSQAVLKESCN